MKELCGMGYKRATGARVPSLALGLTGRTEKLARNEQTKLTTQRRPRDVKRIPIYDKGEACAAFPATAAGDLMAGFRDVWSFLGDTCEASLQAILLFCISHPMLC